MKKTGYDKKKQKQKNDSGSDVARVLLYKESDLKSSYVDVNPHGKSALDFVTIILSFNFFVHTGASAGGILFFCGSWKRKTRESGGDQRVVER